MQKKIGWICFGMILNSIFIIEWCKQGGEKYAMRRGSMLHICRADVWKSSALCTIRHQALTGHHIQVGSVHLPWILQNDCANAPKLNGLFWSWLWIAAGSSILRCNSYCIDRCSGPRYPLCRVMTELGTLRRLVSVNIRTFYPVAEHVWSISENICSDMFTLYLLENY